MRVCFFGNFKPDYSRNRIILSGLRRQVVDVVECRSNTRGLRKYVELFRLHQKMRNSYDVLFVPFPGHAMVCFARLISSKPIVFDAFISVYDSLIWDRKISRPFSSRALLYWLMDFFSLRAADLVLFDTNAHISFASKAFHLSDRKFRRLLVGASDDLFFPMEKDVAVIGAPIRVLFYGSYIPLQGTEIIIEAIRMLRYEPFQFRLIGSGPDRGYAEQFAKKERLSNVEFLDQVPVEHLKNEINRADICLGIFGRTEKTQRVIPNKVYESAACGATIITADTSAIHEVFLPPDLYLVPAADPAALAQALRELAASPEKRVSYGANAHQTFRRAATIDVLGAQLAKELEHVSEHD